MPSPMRGDYSREFSRDRDRDRDRDYRKVCACVCTIVLLLYIYMHYVESIAFCVLVQASTCV